MTAMKTNPMLNRNLAAERRASMSRRHFLRGLGACMALPALLSTQVERAAAQALVARAFPKLRNLDEN